VRLPSLAGKDAKCYGPTDQGDLLQALGISVRLEQLLEVRSATGLPHRLNMAALALECAGDSCMGTHAAPLWTRDK